MPEAGKKKEDILERILKGERITKTVKTKRGSFTIVLPLPRDIREIEVEVARKMDGMPESSFQKDTISLFRAYTTLDRVVTEAPEWWNDLESSEDCPDDALVMQLYRGYLLFYKAAQGRIDKSRFRGSSPVGKARTKTEAMGDGAFSGVAHGSEVQGADS